jgi:hypothetical protein
VRKLEYLVRIERAIALHRRDARGRSAATATAPAGDQAAQSAHRMSFYATVRVAA